jgi:DNA-binding CsgD family transcriptional regulator/PAS domain-containing protein
MCTGSELERTEWYCDFLRRAGGYYSMGAVLEKNQDLSCVVTVLRGQPLGPFDTEHRMLEMLAPHFQRALRIHEMVSAYQTSAHALEAVPVAVFVLDLELRVRYRNERAERLLRRQDGLATAGGRLLASTSESQRLLDAAIQGARQVLLRPATAAPPETYFQLDRPSGAAALQAFVSPAKLSVPGLPYSPSVVLCIKDPDAVDSSPAQLRQIFGFTTQEARLAILLARGVDLPTASQRLRISYETARKHLSNLRAKAGADSQSDLVRLVLNGIAPVGRPGESP